MSIYPNTHHCRFQQIIHFSVCALACVFFGFLFFQQITNVRSEQLESYIIRFASAAQTADIQNVIKKLRHSPYQEYQAAFPGIAVLLTPRERRELRTDSRIASLTPDFLFRSTNDGETDTIAAEFPSHLERIGWRKEFGDIKTNVAVAVFDTDIDDTHPNLRGAVRIHIPCLARHSHSQNREHGTHLAGIIAARDIGNGMIGIASHASLISVQVADSNNDITLSSLLCGIDWTLKNAQAYDIRIANMSLAGYGSSDGACGLENGDIFHSALCRMRDIGIITIVSSGNGGRDTSSLIPAAYDDAAITVSALAADDTIASWSSHGQSIDLLAPGSDIRSTGEGGTFRVMSGTSQATAMVSGAAALMLSSQPKMTLAQVKTALLQSERHGGANKKSPERTAVSALDLRALPIR